MNQCCRSYRVRGMAMVLVLTAVAAAGILSYALLSSASMQAQVTSSTADRLQRKYLAESGLNLALYYLQNPTASPVALVYGGYGNVHYPGETGITFAGMSGSVTTTVTNSKNGVFNIVSVATSDTLTTTARAQIKLLKSRTFATSANLKGNVSLTSGTSISGGITTNGSLTKGSAVVTGNIYSSNGASLGGTTYTQTPNYAMTAFQYMPYYFYDGERYTAKTLPATVSSLVLFDTDTVNNPKNVWYADSNVTFNSITSINGTIVLASGRDLTLQGIVTVTPKTGMPAMILGKRLIVSGLSRILQSNGLTYIADEIKKSGSSNLSSISINGAFISGFSGWAVDSGYSGTFGISYNAVRAKLSGFADEMESVDSVQIRSWEIDNGRPQ